MIIEPQNVTVRNGEITYKMLTHNEPFFALGYTADKVVRLLTREAQPADSAISSQVIDGFGATTFEELLNEADARGLIIPPNLMVDID
jgi:hypothetical protein